MHGEKDTVKLEKDTVSSRGRISLSEVGEYTTISLAPH